MSVKSGDTTPSTGKSPKGGKLIFRKLQLRANETAKSPSGKKNTPLRESKASDMVRSAARVVRQDIATHRFGHKKDDASPDRQECFSRHKNSFNKNYSEEKFYTEGVPAMEKLDITRNVSPSVNDKSVPRLKNGSSMKRDRKSTGMESFLERKTESTAAAFRATNLSEIKVRSLGPEKRSGHSNRSEILVDHISGNQKIDYQKEFSLLLIIKS